MMKRNSKTRLILLSCFIYLALTLGVGTIQDINACYEIRAAIQAFDAVNPAPWSQGDHAIRAALMHQGKNSMKRAMLQPIAFGFLLLGAFALLRLSSSPPIVT